VGSESSEDAAAAVMRVRMLARDGGGASVRWNGATPAGFVGRDVSAVAPVGYPSATSRRLSPMEESKRVLCGVLGILIGSLGIHRFMLGDTTGGILRIVITIVTCGMGGLIGFIEGIIYLTKTDEQFIKEYQVGKKAWF
jgi:TM2 domain-containing membrane protein YozV